VNNKRKYFDSLNEKRQDELYKTISPSERAELRVKDEKLEEYLKDLSPEEQNKTKSEIKSVQSKDYVKTLNGLTKDDIAEAFKSGNREIIDAVENIHLVEKGDIGKISPKVMASPEAFTSVNNLGAPLMNEFLKNTKATTEELQDIAKTNISKLDEGHAVRRNIEEGQRPEHIKMREALNGGGGPKTDRNKSPIITPLSGGGGPRTDRNKSPIINPLSGGGGPKTDRN